MGYDYFERIAEAMRWRLLPRVYRDVCQERLTYLSRSKLISLNRVISEIKRRNVQGDFAEFGVALGGSAIVLAESLDGERCFDGYDVFGMIPPPGEKDGDDSKGRYRIIEARKSAGIGGDQYYGYVENLYELVVRNFERFGLSVDGVRVRLHRGLYEETAHLDIAQRLALVHIDCDWYEPVALCLARTRHHLSPGAYVIVDDYNDYSGCREAVEEFVRQHQEMRLVKTWPHAILCRIQQPTAARLE
jgi:asparagine synthase (glutamine-hydrolysing)